VFPVFAGGSSVWIWSLRGNAWPLFCNYPLTVRKHPCRNVAAGALLGTGGRNFLQYTAALLFVCTWAVKNT
jgi:hypothetical protein